MCDTILCIIINLNSVSGSRSSTNYQGPNPNQILILLRLPVSMPWPDPIMKKPNLNYHPHPSGNGRWEMMVATNCYLYILSFFLYIYVFYCRMTHMKFSTSQPVGTNWIVVDQGQYGDWKLALIMDDGLSINEAHLTILTLDLCITPKKKKKKILICHEPKDFTGFLYIHFPFRSI